MEMNYQSLQDQISKADNYYEELCEHHEMLLRECKENSDELRKVEQAINALCGAIISATKMSHVGASQAIEALQSAAGLLNTVYQLLQLNHSYTQITASGGKATNHMIHVSPAIASTRKKLALQMQKIPALGQKSKLHADELKSQQSDDIDQYRAKIGQMVNKLTKTGNSMDDFLVCLADAERLYSEAQINAIMRANQIPY